MREILKHTGFLWYFAEFSLFVVFHMIQRLDSDYVMTGFLGDGQNWTDTDTLDEQVEHTRHS